MPRRIPVTLALLTLVTLLVAAPAFSPDAAAQGTGGDADLIVSIHLTGGVVNSPTGPTITVNDETRNVGLGQAAASTTQFYLITGTTLDGSAVLLGSRAIPELAPSTTNAGTTVLTVPPTVVAGTFALVARANADNAVAEANGGNNVSNASRVLTIGPDLVVAVSVQATGPTVKDSTRNRSKNDEGGAGAGASTTKFYLSVDSNLDATDILVASRAIPALDQQAESTGETPVKLPAGLPAGMYRVIAVADGDNGNAESNEANNVAVAASALSFFSDLIISVATVPRRALAGATISVSDTTTNQGVAQSAPSSTGYYLSRDTALDAKDLFLGSRVIPPLDAGASNLGDTTVVIPDTTPSGCYFIIAAADAGQAVEESREDRNTRARPIKIRPATGASLLCADSDFNGDRKSDILWRHSSGAMAVWLMDDADIVSADSPGSPPVDWAIQGVGDFNGDGNADILWRHASGLVAIWFMDGATIVSADSPGSPPVDWTIQGVGDFNGDGLADIVWRHASGFVAIWLMDGTTIVSADSPGSPTLDWTIQGVGDFNGDGQADIVWRHASGLVSIWLMDGTSIASADSLSGPTPDWTIQGLGDFNGDGNTDILWRHVAGLVVIWLMDGTNIGSADSLAGPTPDLTIQGVGDFNGDGSADIVWRDPMGLVGVWFINGASISDIGRAERVDDLEWTIQ